MGIPKRVSCHERYSDEGVDVEDGGQGESGIDSHLRAFCLDPSFLVNRSIIFHPLRS